MRQLMGQQTAAITGVRPEFPCVEIDVLSGREGAGVQLTIEVLGRLPGVDTDLGEILPEGRFHLIAYDRFERLSRSAITSYALLRRIGNRDSGRFRLWLKPLIFLAGFGLPLDLS